MKNGLYTILLLGIANVFMNMAWYGHLQFQKWGLVKTNWLPGIVLISWLIALVEYVFQVPANKLGYIENGGPFTIIELKTIQEVLSLGLFVLVNAFVFKESFQIKHLIGFLFILFGAWIIFKK
jgi:uncharacterized protein (DUF486 family)